MACSNQALEAGRTVKAERCFQRAQLWLDRENLLSGQAEGSVPAVLVN